LVERFVEAVAFPMSEVLRCMGEQRIPRRRSHSLPETFRYDEHCS
jgi:hypothetical protein